MNKQERPEQGSGSKVHSMGMQTHNTREKPAPENEGGFSVDGKTCEQAHPLCAVTGWLRPLATPVFKIISQVR